MPCLVALSTGDTLATLSKEYGMTAAQICALNGVRYDRNEIDKWVMSGVETQYGKSGGGGRRLPYLAANPFDAARQLGWAIFTERSSIVLPEGRRPCVSRQPPPPPPTTTSSGPSSGKTLLGLMAAGWAAWRFLR